MEQAECIRERSLGDTRVLHNLAVGDFNFLGDGKADKLTRRVDPHGRASLEHPEGSEYSEEIHADFQDCGGVVDLWRHVHGDLEGMTRMEWQGVTRGVLAGQSRLDYMFASPGLLHACVAMGVWHEGGGFCTDHHMLCARIHMPSVTGRVRGLHGKGQATHVHMHGRGRDMPKVAGATKQTWEKYSAHMLSCNGTHTGVAMREAAKAVGDNQEGGKAEECLAELLHTMHEHVRIGGVAALGAKGRGKGHRESAPKGLKHLRAVSSACADVIKLYSLQQLSTSVRPPCMQATEEGDHH